MSVVTSKCDYCHNVIVRTSDADTNVSSICVYSKIEIFIGILRIISDEICFFFILDLTYPWLCF